MKKILALLLILLLLTGCRTNRGQSSSFAPDENGQTQPPASSAPGEESSAPPADEGAEESEPEAEQSILNSAMEQIAGGEKLRDSQTGLFLLREYPSGMKWMEANRLENLERGTPTADEGTYFLLIPKYIGSAVKVQRMEWNEKDFVPTKTLYHNKSTPDSYALVLTNDEPEGGPNLRVVVTVDGQESICLFSYDGKGDRPEVRVFPDDERWWEAE